MSAPMSLNEMMARVAPENQDELMGAIVRCIEKGYAEWWGMSEDGSPVFALTPGVRVYEFHSFQEGEA